MPNVVLEAIGSGLPVVATRVPGSEDLVHDGKNGLILPAKDSADMSEAQVKLINDRRRRDDMGAHSRDIAKEYAWTLVAEQYLELYQQIAERRACAQKKESPAHV